jgi:hypothetical protein
MPEKKGGGSGWGDFTDKPATGQPSGTGQWGDWVDSTTSIKQEESFTGRMGAAASRYLSQVNPLNVASAIGGAVRHPIDTVNAIIADMGKTQEKARSLAKEGRYLPATATGLLGMVPVVGPPVARAAEMLGDPETAGAGAIDLLALGTGPKVAKGSMKLAGKAAPFMEDYAKVKYGRALDPAMRYTKVLSEKVIPGLIKERVWGSQKGIAKTVSERLDQAGDRLDAAIDDIQQKVVSEPVTKTTTATSPILGPTGKPITTTSTSTTMVDYPGGKFSLAPIKKAMAEYKEQFMTAPEEMEGKKVVGNPQAVKAIEDVQKILNEHGENVSFTTLRKLRTVMDGIVAPKHGFDRVSPKAELSHDILASREAANSMREILGDVQAGNQTTTIALKHLNAEFSFWKKIETILTETRVRKIGQKPPLSERIGSIGEMMHVAAEGTASRALLPVAVGRTIVKILNSPSFNTLSAIQLDRLSALLSHGKLADIAQFATGIGIPLSTVDRVAIQKEQEGERKK